MSEPETKAAYTRFTNRMQVTVPEGEVDGLRVERFTVIGNELWNLRAELRDGRGCEPGTYTRLIDTRSGTMWMSDTTVSPDGIRRPADNSTGLHQINKYGQRRSKMIDPPSGDLCF